MPQLRRTARSRPLAATRTAATLGLLACLPLLTGCLFSQDRRSYVSTPFVLKTVSVIDQKTGEVEWSMDIPVSHELSVDLHRKDVAVHRSDTRYRSAAPANEFSYWLYDINSPGKVPDGHSGKLIKHETLEIKGNPIVALQVRVDNATEIPVSAEVEPGPDGFVVGSPAGSTQPTVTPDPDGPNTDGDGFNDPIPEPTPSPADNATAEPTPAAEENDPPASVIDDAFGDGSADAGTSDQPAAVNPADQPATDEPEVDLPMMK